MTWFNRIVVILLLLALLLICTVGLIVPREALQLLSDGLDELEGRLDSPVTGVELLIRVGLALVIDCILVVLLYLQFRAKPKFGVPVQQVEGSEAHIAVKSVVERLAYHIDPLPGVLNVEPTVTPRRRGVEVALEVEIVPDTDLPASIEEISAVARRVIEHELGLQLAGKPKLKLRTVTAPEPAAGAVVQEPIVSLLDEKADTEEPAVSEVDDEQPAGELNEPPRDDLSG